MNKEQAIAILGSKQLITSAGRYTVKTSFCGDHSGDHGTIAIANFGAMTSYQQEKAIELLKAGEYAKACNQGLSNSVRANDFRPGNGERVNIDVEEVTLKSGEKALLVVGCTPLAISKASKADFSAFADEDASVEASSDATEIS